MAWGSRRLALAALLLIGAAVLWLGGARPQQAHAAPCPVPTYGMDTGGNLSIQGTPPCAEDPEVIAPYCSGGTVWFEYSVNGVPQGPVDTAVACGAPTHLSVFGNAGDDTLDLSRVNAANGFTGITQPNFIDGGYGNDTQIGSSSANIVHGGPGNDIVLARNGLSDAVDCGDGTDAVQSDRQGVDSLLNCEIVDLAATPLVPPTPAAPPSATIGKVKVNPKKNSATITFSGSGGLGGLSFKCKLDKGKFKACTSPKTYKHLKPGKHKVSVEAIDSSGTAGSPVTRGFRIKG